MVLQAHVEWSRLAFVEGAAQAHSSAGARTLVAVLPGRVAAPLLQGPWSGLPPQRDEPWW